MSEQSPIQVLIVDDHTIVREGLITLLESFPDLTLVGAADNGREAVALCEQRPVDVVLMDLMMPDMDGISAIRLIRQKHPDIQLIALTSIEDKELVKQALEAGAIGYLIKNTSVRELVKAIKAAHAGEPTISSAVTRALISAVTDPSPPGGNLTAREREVLAQLVKGLSNSQIADRLNVSPSTVKNHVSSILAKLQVSTRTEAATLAIRHRIVSDN